MDYHHHARLTVYSRELFARNVIEGRLSLRSAAAECGLSRPSASKWVARYRLKGKAGLADRAGQKVAFDGSNMKITNVDAANKYMHRDYRKGWEL
jgi:transposase